MGYNRENFIRIKREYDGKNLAAKRAAESRADELHAAIPELRDIDRALSETGLKLFYAATAGGEGLEERFEVLKRENLELQQARALCLKANGYPEDYSDVKYECEVCSDTGFHDLRICECMRRRLILAGYESSGIAGLIATQSFETFDPEYFSYDRAAHNSILDIYGFCRRYAAGFSPASSGNLLLIGPTGLGKTHLSTSIAKVLIENGFDVAYDTAQNVFSDFEYERFNRPYNSGEAYESRTDRFFNCELLIIDDLGTEMTNQFTVSCLYNVINTRLNRRLPMVINTNLTVDDLRQRYADRITSRLLGEFAPLLFTGRDVRRIKLEKNL